MLWLGIFSPDAKIIATAPGKPQIQRFLWPEIRKWREFLPKELKDTIEVTGEMVRFGNGNEAFGRTAPRGKPEGLAGGHGQCVYWIVDEASGIEPEVFQTIEGSLTGDYTGMVLLSQPTRTDGYFFDTHHKAKDGWKAFAWSAENSSLVSPNWLEGMKVKYRRDDPIYQIRVLGNFVELSKISLITLDMIQRAVEKENSPDTGSAVWGVDVGLTSDQSVVAKRKFLRTLEVKKYNIDDPMRLSAEIFFDYQHTPLERRPSKINVEMNGIGVAVSSRLKQLGAPVVACDVSLASMREKCKNKRAEMYLNLRDALELGLSIPDDEVLHTDMVHGSQYFFNQKAEIQLIKKIDIKKEYGKSPDVGDALALTFYEELAVEVPKSLWTPEPEIPCAGLG
jgi:phage terminase large subunit